jgi:hypothetical protein
MLLIVFVQPFFFCEKDDICESTVEKTPLLVIQFFDGENIQSQTPKNVNDLRIIAPEFIGIENHTPLFFDGVSEIKIPLKIDQDETEFYFYLNADNADLNLRNTDKINIKYTRDDIYISRACGYKTYFELDFLDPFLFSEPIENVAYPDGGALWIRSINIVNTEINQDEAAHIYIYF